MARSGSGGKEDSNKGNPSKPVDKTIKASQFRKLHAERNKENVPVKSEAVASSSKEGPSIKKRRDKTIKASEFRKRAAEAAKQTQPVLDTDAGLWGSDSPDVSVEKDEIPPDQPSTSGIAKKSFITCRPMNVQSTKSTEALAGTSTIVQSQPQVQPRAAGKPGKKDTSTRLDGKNKISKNKKPQPGKSGSKVRPVAGVKKPAKQARKVASKKKEEIVERKSDENLFAEGQEKVCSSEVIKELFGKKRTDVPEQPSCEIGGEGLMAETDAVQHLSQEIENVKFGDECSKKKNPNLDFLNDNDIHKYHRFIPSDKEPGEIEHDVILTDEEVDDDDIIDGCERRDSDAEEYCSEQGNMDELDSLSKRLATQKKSEDLGKKERFVVEQEKSKNL